VGPLEWAARRANNQLISGPRGGPRGAGHTQAQGPRPEAVLAAEEAPQTRGQSRGQFSTSDELGSLDSLGSLGMESSPSGGQLEAIRSGDYVCSCPNYAPHVSARLSQLYGRAREQLVDSLLARASGNSSLEFLQQLSSERQQFANSLVSAQHHRVGALLASRRQSAGSSSSLNSNSNGRPASKTLKNQASYFTLGAQLEADAVLELTANSTQPLEAAPSSASSEQHQQAQQEEPISGQLWPQMGRKVCTVCAGKARASQQEGAPDEELQCDEELQTAGGQPEGRPLGSPPLGQRRGRDGHQLASWTRPIVLGLQSSCILLTLALIGIILRIRKSRVSSNHSTG